MATFDDRGENGSIICSQLSLSAREESFEESTVAGAIMDRMIHTAIPVEGKGASMHKQPRQSNRAKATAPKQPRQSNRAKATEPKKGGERTNRSWSSGTKSTTVANSETGSSLLAGLVDTTRRHRRGGAAMIA
ncbi:MAG: ATP-binding protein [Ferrimicrobium sp.]